MQLVPDTDAMVLPQVHTLRQPTRKRRWSSYHEMVPNTDVMALRWVRCSCCERQREHRNVQHYLQRNNPPRVPNTGAMVWRELYIHATVQRHNDLHWLLEPLRRRRSCWPLRCCSHYTHSPGAADRLDPADWPHPRRRVPTERSKWRRDAGKEQSVRRLPDSPQPTYHVGVQLQMGNM